MSGEDLKIHLLPTDLYVTYGILPKYTVFISKNSGPTSVEIDFCFFDIILFPTNSITISMIR